MIKRLRRSYGLEWSRIHDKFHCHTMHADKKAYLFGLLLNHMLTVFNCEVYWGTLYYRITYDSDSDASVSGTDA